jgi:hypothetical protein
MSEATHHPVTEPHERQLRRAALEEWGEAIGLVPEEIARLQELEEQLQDREVEARGAVFVTELLNHYHCDDCDTSWSDAWCCACDDECPRCGDPISPEDSDVVGVEILALKRDRCTVCGETHEF